MTTTRIGKQEYEEEKDWKGNRRRICNVPFTKCSKALYKCNTSKNSTKI